MVRTSFAVALAALTLLPSSAFAQSAGDEQYSDPLQNAPAPQQEAPAPESAPAPAPQSPGTTGSAPAAPVDPSATVSPGATAADGSTGATAAGEASTLPYTGVDARLPGSLGAILLGLGMLLSLGLTHPRQQ